jgi:amino acid adenylation domain-containing protein
MRYPVSFAQQRLWFLDQLEPNEPTYNMPYATWLDGPLDPAALQRAMDALVARHSILRTRLVAVDGIPEQDVAESGTITIARVSAEDTARAESLANDIARTPFDLAAQPPMRTALIDVDAEQHLLVVVMHHSAGDGATIKIVMEELSALYRAETGGGAASLPELWIDYGDYAVWQRERMRGAELERLLSYWRGQLRGAPEVLSLPTDRPRPARMSSRGASARVVLDPALTGRLAALAQGADATMFMLFLTGFVATLSRYAHQSDIVVDTQVAGRTHTELEPMVGMFTNTVLLRTSLADDATFSALLRRLRDITVDALMYEDLPFEKLIEDLAPDRTLAHAPLTQVQFVYGSLYSPPLEAPGLTSRGTALLTGTSKLDLTMYADTWDDQTTSLTLEYSTDLFDPPWAQRFLHCQARLLESAAQAPDAAVSALPMLSPADCQALVVGRNAHPVPSDKDVDLRPAFLASPSQIIDHETTRPMSEVCDRAARIARVLVDRGVTAQTLVGLCLGRSADLLAALLAVWWAGAAYVPLDAAFPPARLTAMARGAGLRVILTDAAHSDLVQSMADDAQVIRVDDPAVAAAEPLAPVPLPPAALAYVIFTSGSTGQPKGVAIEHRAVRNLLQSFRRAFGLGQDDRFVAVTTLSFDIAVLEMLLPGFCGTDLVIATADETREPDRLRALIGRTGASVLQATPQTWRLLEAAGGVPASVRLRLCGGEAFPVDLAERLLTTGSVVWNLYGPTETTVWSAAGVVTSAAQAPEIGPPIDHTRVYILDGHLNPVPVGVIGEVCIGGRGVARGYHERPRLTARSFVPDPWSDEPGARMYRTGDLGRWREGSGLELIGRNDHQVKIHGFRIECGEIESVLRTHRDVRQAVVVSAPRGADAALVAYVVPRRGSAAAQPGANLLEELRPHLRLALPDYMIPSLIVALPALPLTPNAKVDRAALPAPRWDAVPSAAGQVAPRNPVEQTLADMWSELLATQVDIGVHDNLFALGGHSLTATRFVARVVDTYGVSLPVHQVFVGPTIAELAEVITADPDFGQVARSSRHVELDALSDEDLDELLRAALAQRHRRRAAAGWSEA